MANLWLRFILESDATFGRGDGIAGLVDAEIQHDEYGLPYLSGRTLKSLLTAECAEILFALTEAQRADLTTWRDAARFLFGETGSRHESAHLRVGDARLPLDVQDAVIAMYRPLEQFDETSRSREWGLKRTALLDSLTALRRQTAIDEEDGAPKDETLRTMRVVLRQTPFEARLDLDESDNEIIRNARALLAATVTLFRRAGTGRNRGRGKLRARLWSGDGQTDVTENYLTSFREAMSR
jgi:hypothetical protein